MAIDQEEVVDPTTAVMTEIEQGIFKSSNEQDHMTETGSVILALRPSAPAPGWSQKFQAEARAHMEEIKRHWSQNTQREL